MESSSIASGQPAAGAAGTEGHESAKGLKSGALGLFSSIIIGVSSVAPAYSLAATLGIIAAVAGPRSPGVMLVAAIPMLMVAAAFYYMNKADPDCGQSFIWSVRAFGPHVGWVIGFVALAASMIVMANLVQIASLYMLQFFGLHGMADSTFWVTVFGVAWLLAVAVVVAIGIELSARTQYVMMGVQMGAMFLFAIWAIIKAFSTHPEGYIHHIYLTQFFVRGMSWNNITQGIVAAVFLYWGWDTVTSINEESENKHTMPGVSAILSMIILVFTYVFITWACQTYHGSMFLVHNMGDVFTPLAHDVMGSPWDKIVLLAVFTSGAASALTTLMPLTRSSLSMSAHKAFPKAFGRVHPKYQTPFWGTVIMTVISIAWYVGMTAISTNILYDAIDGLGLMVCLVYGFTGFAAAIYYRKELFKSVKNFLFMGLVPFLGGAMMMVVFYYAGKTYWDPTYSYTWWDTGGIHLFGLHIGMTFALGIGPIILGIILMFILWPVYRAFFGRKPETWPGEGEPIPYSDETVL